MYNIEQFTTGEGINVTVKYVTEDKHEFGGYMIPDTISLPVKGFMGKFYRLINNKRGWYDYHLYDEIMKRINKRREQENYGSKKRED